MVTDDPQLWTELRKFGDRTSSFLSAYPGFKSFLANGTIRYVETPLAWGRSQRAP